MDNYWTATEDYLKEHGGKGPKCSCGKYVTPQDDHGRFVCFGCGYGLNRGGKIPQVTKDLSDEEKAKIPPINRLHLTPTKEEQKLLEDMLGKMQIDIKNLKKTNSKSPER